MEEHVIARYKSHEGAKSYNTKYDREWHKRVNTRHEYDVIRRCFEIVGPQDRILDLPAGTGRLFRAFQSFGKRYFEMDISLEMLKFNRTNLAEFKPSVAEASAFHIPLRSRTIDCVFSARLFHHVPDPNERTQYIRELCRISNGWVVMTFFHTWSIKNILRRIRRPFNRKKPKVTMTTSELREIAAQEGMTVVTTIPLSRLFSGHHFAILRRC